MGPRRLNILVLSFYFPPDLCAGSFRATSVVDALVRRVIPGSRIDVITTQPNRYHSFAVEAAPLEAVPGCTIFRISLPKHRSGLVDQARAFFAFAQGAAKCASGREYDIIFATSSRLMTAVLGARIAGRKQAALYLDLRDIFADTIKEVLSSRIAWVLAPGFSALERWAVRRAAAVNLVSGGFAEYFGRRYPAKSFSYFTNGIDDDFLAAAPISVSPQKSPESAITILYAGNLGEGQGLHTILPDLARRMGPTFNFKIIGDGGRRNELERALAAAGVQSVKLLPPMARDALIHHYQKADVLFLHLNSYEAFKKVLPSKVFEYAAMGKPIWAGVSGYAAEFIAAEISNAAVFAPGEVEAAARSFSTLALRDEPRSAFVAKYSRRGISERLADDIVTRALSTETP